MTLERLDRDPEWWNLPVIGLTQSEQASRRWAKRNAEMKAAGCRCGQPATEVRFNHDNTGTVPVEYWTCVDHVGVNAWQNDGDGIWYPTEREGSK